MAKIVSLGIGKELTVNIEGAEGQSLPDVLGDVGIQLDGNAVFLNGARLTASEAASATVRNTDTVELQPKAEGGRG